MKNCGNSLRKITDDVISLLSVRDNFNYPEIARHIIEDNKVSSLYVDLDGFDDRLNELKENEFTIINGEQSSEPFLFDNELLKKAVSTILSENNYTLNPEKDGVPLFDFSDNLKIFKTNSVQNYTQSLLYNEVFKFSFINNTPGTPINDVFIIDDGALNRNILRFKNKLWNSLSPETFLYNEKTLELNRDLFDSGTYYSVLEDIKNKYDNLVDWKVDDETVQKYINAVILSNFDGLIKSELSDIISVNPELINSYSIPNLKYSLEFRPVVSVAYDKDTAENSGIDKHTSSFIKYFAETIPLCKFTKGEWAQNIESAGAVANVKIGIKRINAIASLINSESSEIDINEKSYTLAELLRQIDHGEFTLKELLRNILDTFEENPDKLSSLYLHRDTIVSIYKYFYVGKYNDISNNPRNGLINVYNQYLNNYPENRSLIINPELAFLNYLKSNALVVYNIQSLDEVGRSVNALNFDAKVSNYIEGIYQSLKSYWTAKSPEIKNYKIEDLSAFLKKFGDFEFSINTKKYFEGITDQSLGIFKTGETIDINEDNNSIKRLITLDEFSNIILNLNNGAIFKALVDSVKNEPLSIMSEIKSAEGNSLPTVSITNLISSYQRVLADANQRDAGKNNVLVRNRGLIDSFEVSEELETTDGSAKSTFSFNGEENFTLFFTRHFISSIVNKGNMFVQPWNFSDKSKLYIAKVNSNLKIDEKKSINEMTVPELKEAMFSEQNKYFSGLVNSVFLEYLKLEEFAPFITSKKWSAELVYNTYIDNLNEPASTKIKYINSFLSANGKDLTKLIRKNFNNVDKYAQLKGTTPATKFLQSLSRPELTNELHFSKYSIDGKGTIVFNKFLEKQIEIFSDRDKFNTWSDTLDAKLSSYVENLQLPPEALNILNDSGNISKDTEFIKKAVKRSLNIDISFRETLDKKLILNIKNSDILKKYLWSRNLIISQYANLTTKDAYQHPQKGISLKTDKKGNIIYNDEDFLKDEDIRSTAFTKRMVISGASMALYGKGPSGILNNIKVAVVDDRKCPTFTFTGKEDSVDSWDGAALAIPFFSAFSIKSLPGTGIKRVQKPIGTSISDYYSSLMKFAINGINNEMIRRSIGADVDLSNLVKKSCSEEFDISNIFALKNINVTLDIPKLFDNIYVPDMGKITSIVPHDDYTYTVTYNNNIATTKNFTVKNIYDIYEMLGGAYTQNSKGEYTDDSINAVCSIIEQNELNWLANKIPDPKQRIKDKMIALICSKSAMKNGVTNLNESATLSDNTPFIYFNFDTTNFGIQLDASHAADDAEINEVTQIISAIAENNSSQLYIDTYKAISSIVEKTLDEYFDEGTSTTRLKIFTKQFINTLASSRQNATGKEILDILESKVNLLIPYSNKSFYRPFIATVISKLNTDFIRRKFSGLACVLNVSHGAIQIYEDNTGNTYTSEDLVKMYNGPAVTGTNDDIYKAKLKYVLASDPRFSAKERTLNQINPLDKIRVTDLNGNIIEESVNLLSLSDYYNLKKTYSDDKYKFYKIYTSPRDLKPVEFIFAEEDGTQRNIFDLDPWLAEYAFNNGEENEALDNFIKQLNLKDSKEIKQYLDAWCQRTLEMLAAGYNFPKDYQYTKEEFNYRVEIPENAVKINLLSFKDAEKIVPKTYRGQFQLGSKSMSEINYDFFNNKIKRSIFPPQGSIYDVALTNYMTGNNLYILLSDPKYIEKSDGLYVGENKIGNRIYVNIEKFDQRVVKTNKEGEKTDSIISRYYRMDRNGNKMYEVASPDLKFYKDKFGNELIVEDISNIKNTINTSKKFYPLVEVNNSYSNIQELLSIVLDTNLSDENETYLRRKNQVISEDLKKNVDYTKDIRLTDYANHFIDKMTTVLHSSWLSSLYSIDARIPSQALQSMMSMKAVAYTEDTSNNVYVSAWQTFLQGSDFDIDKVYMMMYEYNNGAFESWSPLFDYKYFEDSLKLSFPNRTAKYTRETEVNDKVWDGDSAYQEWLAKFPTEKPPIVKFYTESLNYLNSHQEITGIKIAQDWIFKNINKHNNYYNEAGAKNFIVHNLISTSRNLRNQVASYTPISFGGLKEAVSPTKAYSLSLYDGHTMGLQQEENAIGKDVTGIAATGLKDYFAMLTAYSTSYSKITKLSPFNNNYFQKIFVINGKVSVKNKIGGLNLPKAESEVLRGVLKESLKGQTYITETGETNTMTDEEIDKLTQASLEGDPALKISSILSAATDNAKELILAKINCGRDFAPMHLYLLILGFDERDVAKYMTSPAIMEIKKSLASNVFIDKKISSIDTKISKLPESNWEVKQFKDIFKASRELTFLGSLLKVNQGNKGTEEEIYTFNSRLINGFCAQERAMFEKTFSSKSKDLYGNMVKIIMADKPYLNNKKEINDIISKADQLGILKYKFSADKFYSDIEYREAATNYYNLMKSTFNVLDIVQKVPHFFSMSRAFYYGEKQIVDSVYKYNWATRAVPEILKDSINSGEIDSKDIFKNISYLSNKDNPIQLNGDILARADDFYDDQMILAWLKDLKYSINLNAVLDVIGKDEMQVLDSNLHAETTITYKSTDNLNLELTSANNIAQFKFLMETYLIPEMKKTTNGFLKEYKKNNTGSYNMAKQIKYYQDICNFAKMNELDSEITKLINPSEEFQLPLVKAGETLYSTNFIDLLFLYNLITNKDRFGGDRATMFFNQYVLKENSLAQKFYEFQNAQDNSGELYENLKNLTNNEDFRKLLYFSLFNKSNKKFGKVATFVVDNSQEAMDLKANGIEVDKTYSVNNSYYTLLDSVDENAPTLVTDLGKTYKRWKSKCGGVK